MTEIMEYLPIIFAISNLIFKYQIFGYFSKSDIVCAAIAILNAVVPMQELVERCFPIDEEVYLKKN